MTQRFRHGYRRCFELTTSRHAPLTENPRHILGNAWKLEVKDLWQERLIVQRLLANTFLYLEAVGKSLVRMMKYSIMTFTYSTQRLSCGNELQQLGSLPLREMATLAQRGTTKSL
ncbi:hypothetical protein Bca101_027023 [Brassica carinata]